MATDGGAEVDVRLLEPTVRLAWALENGPGNYVFLLGAGVSRGAGLPTAWDVLEALIRRVAVLLDGVEPDDPAEWWRAKFGGGPSYPAVLAEVGADVEERRGVLREFFEAVDSDGEPTSPSPAHRAVADLVATGRVRVVLTTNFDLLMEQALRAVGVEPVTVSSASSIDEMAPLHSQRCLVVHLHGDYLGGDMLNTDAELAAYDARVRELVRQVVDEYGVIFVGWSAEWDMALAGAIREASKKRYASWWIELGEPNPVQLDLGSKRSVEWIAATADSALVEVSDLSRSLADLRTRSTPIGTAAAVATAKREITASRRPVRAHELLRHAVDALASSSSTRPENFHVDADEYRRRHLQLLTDAEPAIALTAACVFWGDSEIDRWLVDDIERLSHRPHVSGTTMMIELARAPAVLLMYSAGVAAAACGRWDVAAQVLGQPQTEDHAGSKQQLVSLVIHPGILEREAKGLFTYLVPLLMRHLGWDRGLAVDSWERFEYMHHLTLFGHDAGLAWAPYIRVEGLGPNEGHPTPHRWFDRNLTRLIGDLGGPWLSREPARLAMNRFAEEFRKFAARGDDSLVGPRGGFYPSSRHYPGSFDDIPAV